MSKDRFTTLIADHLGVINEQDPNAMAADPGAAPPAEAPVEAPPVPVPPAEIDGDDRSLSDLAVAAKIALQLKTITPEDRELLLQSPNQDNADSLRELLSNIAGWYDTPQ